jgi:uncharacterized membrane protein YhaH (DUF805 family)
MILYAAAYFPIITLILAFLIVLGYRTSYGFLRTGTDYKVYALAALYMLLLSWPIYVAIARRLRDLGIAKRKFFFSRSARQHTEIAKALFSQEGLIKNDD